MQDAQDTEPLDGTATLRQSTRGVLILRLPTVHEDMLVLVSGRADWPRGQWGHTLRLPVR